MAGAPTAASGTGDSDDFGMPSRLLEEGRTWLSRMAGRQLQTTFRGPKGPTFAESLGEVATQKRGRKQEVSGALSISSTPSASRFRRGLSAADGADGADDGGARCPDGPPTLFGAEAGARRRRQQRQRVHPTVSGAFELPSIAAAPAAPSGPRAFVDLTPRSTVAQPPQPGGQGSSSRCQLGGAAADGPAPLMLPRVPVREKPDLGTVCTVHISEERADEVLARYDGPVKHHRGALSARGGEAPPADRKWHLRQAPLSARLAHGVRHQDATSATAASGSPKTFGSGKGPPHSEYLSFEEWGVEDAYFGTLLDHSRWGAMRHVNLAGNRLTATAIRRLSKASEQQPFASLETLNLTRNRLGHSGGVAVGEFLLQARPPLRELDLSENSLGDPSCVEIVRSLRVHYRGLVGLSLAANNLGHNGRFGVSLENFVSAAHKLQALDLHWNHLNGNGAASLLQGILDNALMCKGQLWRVNLAWNRLGLRCKESQQGAGDDRADRPPCSCEACRACNRAVGNLARVFAESSSLFHLDISYNGLGTSDCATLSTALANNHTLFGLHLTGNAACLDDVGFVVVHAATAPAAGGAAGGAAGDLGRVAPHEVADREAVRMGINDTIRNTPRELQLQQLGPLQVRQQHLRQSVAADVEKVRELAVSGVRKNPSLACAANADGFSPRETEAEMEWVGVHGKVQRLGYFGEVMHTEDVRVNEHCCWICENWVQETVAYVPGWSGPEAAPGEVAQVFAYFSTDGFTRPTMLAKTTDVFFEQLFGAGGKGQNGRSRRSLRCKDEDDLGVERVRRLPDGAALRGPFVNDMGRYTFFQGSRMLPPSTMPVKVVFQVNETIRAADHMPKERISRTSIAIVQDGQAQSKDGLLPPVPVPVAPPQTADVVEVNRLCVGARALHRFEQGLASALCLLEDPRLRGEIRVVPRKLQYAREVVLDREFWKYETSVFKDYTRDADDTFASCFDHDFKACKLEKLLARNFKYSLKPMRDLVRREYRCVIAAFHGRAFWGFSVANASAGVSFRAFAEILSARADCGEPPPAEAAAAAVGPARDLTSGPVFGANFTSEHADVICIGANVLDKQNALTKDLEALPPTGLARFQFLEAFVRVAMGRFMGPAGAETPEAATKELMRVLNVGQDFLHWRLTLQQAMFCELCCQTIEPKMPLLDEAFSLYSKRLKFVGREGCNTLTLAAWIEFLCASGAPDFGLPPAMQGVAFALGREARVDEFKCYRHMELSFPEFIVCIGAAVRLSGDFSPCFFPDRLLAFIEGPVARAVTAARSNARLAPMDLATCGTTGKLVALAARVFAEADADGNGNLTPDEFKCSLKENVLQSFSELGIQRELFNVVFFRLDTDKSGAITERELCEGLVDLKNVMIGQEQVVAYLYKLHREAAGDSSLTKEDFQGLVIKNPGVRAELKTLGVSAEDCDDFWAAVDAQDTDGLETVAAEEMIAGFLALRDPVARGQCFLRQVFKRGDYDCSGTISRVEVEGFYGQAVSGKLCQMGLVSPDWRAIFDAIDIDSDGVLSWDEIAAGVGMMWKAAGETKNQTEEPPPPARQQQGAEPATLE